MQFVKDDNAFFATCEIDGVSAIGLAKSVHGIDLMGTELQCERLNLAMARLIVNLGISKISTKQITKDAEAYLRIRQTELSFGELVEMLDADIRLGEFVSDLGEIEALRRIERQNINVIERHKKPKDEYLFDQYEERLGFGGGGT
jgi:hypothetical protein